MRSRDFFNGSIFELISKSDGYEYVYNESDSSKGYIKRRLKGQEWQYAGGIEDINQRGVRVMQYWFGKRISVFLFFSNLNDRF